MADDVDRRSTNASSLGALLSDAEKVSSRMREALRRDFCSKLAAMPAAARQQFRERLVAQKRLPCFAIDYMVDGVLTYARLAADAELVRFVDNGDAVQPLLEVTTGLRRSYLSLNTAWEHLNDWLDVSNLTSVCSSAWEVLTSLGTLGLPIEVKRRLSPDLSPYAIEVTRVCASPADTSSFVAALRAQSSIVPPEGGAAVEDILVLVDPDAPRASRLVLSSVLIKEVYASVVHCREINVYQGKAMHLALHAHSLLNIVQPPSPGVRRQDLEAHLRRQFLGRAYQCATCGFGPIDHFACGDLAAHNGQRVGSGVIDNACPRCGWFSKYLSEWPKWDGTVPEESLLACTNSSEKSWHITAASAEVALRICYSARALFDTGSEGEAHHLCSKLANWESLTCLDGVDHPVQLLLALAVIDDLPDGVFGLVPLSQWLTEVCARRAENEFQRVGAIVGRRRVGAFLGVSFFSAPTISHDLSIEMQAEAVLESCRADYRIDPEAFDFKTWVKSSLMPWAHAILFVRRLRNALDNRGGGWRQLSRDMEAGPAAYADIILQLQKPAEKKDSPAALLGVRCKEDSQRVLAAVAAQAFLHWTPQSRRTKDVGGALDEPLGDVRESHTLRGLAVELRMLYYYDALAEKRRKCNELRQLLDKSHVHSLPKRTFWELWSVCNGDDRRRFLISANQGFVDRFG